MALTQVKTAGIANDAVTGAKIADDQINSEHYVDGSIDNAHVADDQINSEHYHAGSIDHEHLATDIIDGDNIADNAIDSEHYTDGSIDNEHLADNAVDLAEMAHGTQGDVLYYGSGGAPTRLGAGTSGQFLKTQGGSANPVWAAAGGGKIVDVKQTVRHAASSFDLTSHTSSSGQMSTTHTVANSANKLLIIASVNISVGIESKVYIDLAVDDAITTFIGDAAGSATRVGVSGWITGNTAMENLVGVWLYTPGDASSHTYAVKLGQGSGEASSKWTHINRDDTSTNHVDFERAVSTLTLIEVDGT